MNNWEQVQQLQVNAYVERLLSSFDIKETTTDRQLKNGTRIFKYGDEFFGIYKSGMVRKIIRTTLFNESSCYQLNLTRKRKTDYMFFEDNNKLTVRTYETVKRVPIVQELGRLVYLTEYLIKNRGMKKKDKEFVTDFSQQSELLIAWEKWLKGKESLMRQCCEKIGNADTSKERNFYHRVYDLIQSKY
jgi:hypothetical protein